MTLDAFKLLPDNARVWIYAFRRPLEGSDRQLIDERLAAFMRSWHSHNADVEGAFAILHDRFVVLSGASRDGMSGCSIDSSVENFKFFRDEHGLDALDRNLVHYRDTNGAIHALDRAEFKAEMEAGRCGSETVVFDLTIRTLGDLRAGRFEMPLTDTWHAKIFLPV